MAFYLVKEKTSNACNIRDKSKKKMQSQRDLTQKSPYYMIPLIWSSRPHIRAALELQLPLEGWDGHVKGKGQSSGVMVKYDILNKVLGYTVVYICQSSEICTIFIFHCM